MPTCTINVGSSRGDVQALMMAASADSPVTIAKLLKKNAQINMKVCSSNDFKIFAPGLLWKQCCICSNSFMLVRAGDYDRSIGEHVDRRFEQSMNMT